MLRETQEEGVATGLANGEEVFIDRGPVEALPPIPTLTLDVFSEVIMIRRGEQVTHSNLWNLALLSDKLVVEFAALLPAPNESPSARHIPPSSTQTHRAPPPPQQ